MHTYIKASMAVIICLAMLGRLPSLRNTLCLAFCELDLLEKMLSPFDSGKTFIFKSMADGGPHASILSPAISEVNLAYSTDYSSNIGTHYKSLAGAPLHVPF